VLRRGARLSSSHQDFVRFTEWDAQPCEFQLQAYVRICGSGIFLISPSQRYAGKGRRRGGARWRDEVNSLVRRTQNFVRSEIAELVPILSLVNSHLTCFEDLHFFRLFRNLISISIMKRLSYKVVGSTTELRGHCPIFRKAFLQNHSTKPQIRHPDCNGSTCRRRFNQGS
jgi:hypothetical protein